MIDEYKVFATTKPFIHGVLVTLVRFVAMVITLALLPLFGVGGWWLGFGTNIVVSVLAIYVVTALDLWPQSGMKKLNISYKELLIISPLLFEALIWIAPGGISVEAPGVIWWMSTLLLVGLNEELFSRVVILSGLRSKYSHLGSAALTGLLFGLQHFSALALTSRGLTDVAGNVLLSGIYGFTLAAVQLRITWITPLILIHALADFTTLFAAQPLTDLAIGILNLGFLLYGTYLVVTLDAKETKKPIQVA